MYIIKPRDTTDSTLTSSNVAETENTEWAGTTVSYSIDDEVRVTTSGVHKTYQAIVAITANAGNLSPEIDVLETVPEWVETGATNRWKMFSSSAGEITTNASTIIVRITPGLVVNAVCLLGVAGSTVRIRMNDSTDGDVYDETINLVATSGINNWHAYYFTDITLTTDLVINDLPSYGTAYIEITITSTTTAECELCILGVTKDIGRSQYGANVGITDYSVKETDDYGRTNIVERSFAKRMDIDVQLDATETDSVHKLLSQLRATPVVWVGSDLFQSTIIYGYFRDFDVVIASYPWSECSLEIEGLI